MTNVLVKGANRGLGFGFVKKYIGKNIHLVCTTQDIKTSKELLGLKEKYPNNLEIFEIDFLKESAKRTLTNLLDDRPIDILINNAGVGSIRQHFYAVSPKSWLEVLNVNLIVPLMVALLFCSFITAKS